MMLMIDNDDGLLVMLESDDVNPWVWWC